MIPRRKTPMSSLIRELHMHNRHQSDIAAGKVMPALRRFAVGDKVTDGLIHGTVTQLDPNRPLVGVEFFPWPNERKWDWFSEDRLRRDE